jgi:hypothetical protein
MHTANNGPMQCPEGSLNRTGLLFEPGKEAALLPPPPLRTGREVGWAASELSNMGTFPAAPRRTVLDLFSITRLSRDLR